MFLLVGSVLVTPSSSPAINQIPPIVKPVPGGAYLSFAGKMGGEIAQSHVAKTTSIAVKGCASGSTITSFVLAITKNGSTKKLKGSSGDLTKAMRQSLASLKVGDSFEFLQVKAKTPKGGIHDVHARKFTLV